MSRSRHPSRRLVAAATATALLFLSSAGATPTLAQSSGYAAEIAKIDLAQRRVTLKASMGQESMRVAAGVALDALKPGDKVRVRFGQQGTEAVITRIEVVKP